MVLKARNIVPDLGIDLGQKVIIGGIERAGEHRVLPDKNAKLVTDVVKAVTFIPSAAPDPDHVHIGVDGRLQQIAKCLGPGLTGERVLRNPVRPHGEDRPAIHPEHETAPSFIQGGNKFHPAQADAFCDRPSVKRDHQIMQGLRPLMHRPPQRR